MLRAKVESYVKLPNAEIPENLCKEMMRHIRDGIHRKIRAVRDIQTIDKEIAAGLYVYAVEEFGKLLLLRDTQSLNGKRKVKYDKGFLDHCRKFTKAFDYFQKNGLDACKVLALDFEINDAVLNDVYIRLLANTEARLTIFYSDFSHDNNQNIIIEKPPAVDLSILRTATDQLEKATNGLRI